MQPVPSHQVWAKLEPSEQAAIAEQIALILAEEVEYERFPQDPSDAPQQTRCGLPAQSDPKQVRKNRESAANQRALQERLRELNWKQNQISIIDGDQGTSARQAVGREGFQTLVADVGLGKIGIIMGYEVSRLRATVQIGIGC